MVQPISKCISGDVLKLILEVMNLGKIDAIGFYSSNITTQSFSGPFTSP